jgi:hypothetical protein
LSRNNGVGEPASQPHPQTRNRSWADSIAPSGALGRYQTDPGLRNFRKTVRRGFARRSFSHPSGYKYTAVLVWERINASSGLQHVHSYQEPMNSTLRANRYLGESPKMPLGCPRGPDLIYKVAPMGRSRQRTAPFSVKAPRERINRARTNPRGISVQKAALAPTDCAICED